METDDSSAMPEIVLITDEGVPSDCRLFAIVVGKKRIGYIVIGPDGETYVTGDPGDALAFARSVTRVSNPGFGH